MLQLQYLPSADAVAVLREGRVAERGTYAELLRRGVDFHQFEIEDDQEDGEGESYTLCLWSAWVGWALGDA